MDRNSLPDDPTIGPDSVLWRRIHPRWVVFDESQQVLRISSAAFDNSPDGDPMSAHLAEDFEKVGRSAANVLDGHPGYGVAKITARDAREQQQRVARTYELGPGHVSVIGEKKKRTKRQLAAAARWVIRNASEAILDELRVSNPPHFAILQGKDVQSLMHPPD